MPRPVPETLLIPVETLNREFDAKLLLALKAAGSGLKPIIGGRTRIHDSLLALPPSIYLAKGIRTGNRLIMSILHRLGHVIVALDEEALIRMNDDALLLMLDEETFNRPRLLYAWGRSNAELWRRFKGYRGTPILETGNPRIDLLRPEVRRYYAEAADRLNQRFGRFVLFSSNFSMVNHFIPDHVRFRVAPDASGETADELKGGITGHKQVLYQRFRTLVPRLAAAIAPAALVIRPHPSENAANWSKIAAGLGNVQVIHEGPIAPWLIAAGALLHNGCTSAVEAAVLGTPAFSYRPIVNTAFDPLLPNALSIELSDDDDIIEAIDTALKTNPGQPDLSAEQLSLLHHNIASVDGELAADRILQSLAERRGELAAGRPSAAGDRLIGQLRHVVRGATRRFTTRLAGKSSGAYTVHKFPGIGEAEVNARIARFRAVVPGLPAIEAKERLPSIFELVPA
jgi:surface carbohydrate biosynthesis protein